MLNRNILFLLIILISPLHALDLYIKPVIIQDEPTLSIDDVVFTSVSSNQLLSELHAVLIDPISPTPALISPTVIRERLAPFLPDEFILVGGYTIFIPSSIVVPLYLSE